MTIAISVKVDEGIILASDSASTVTLQDPDTGKLRVLNVYNHAKKIFRLHEHLPVGAICWGLGAIGRSSLKILAKGFREELMDSQAKNQFDPGAYTIEDVTHRFRQLSVTGRKSHHSALWWRVFRVASNLGKYGKWK